MREIEIALTSDFICPWCHIGEERLFAAARRAPGIDLIVRWLPFELNATMPADGLDRRAYRSRKFGSWERSLALDAHVAEVGRAQGLAFDFTRMTRTPSTRLAHRLAWYAAERGVQAALVPAIFRAYFEEGRDIGDIAELVKLAADAGIDPDDARPFLEGDGGVAEVERLEAEATRAGIHAVPHFAIGREIFDGALDEDALVALLRTEGARS